MVSSEAALCELSAPPVVVLVVAVVCCRPYDEPDFFVSVSEAMYWNSKSAADVRKTLS